MMAILLFILIGLLQGCASGGQKSILDRIEFDDDEYGCARIQGQVNMSVNPFAGADAQVLVIKQKDNPDPDVKPEDKKAMGCP